MTLALGICTSSELGENNQDLVDLGAPIARFVLALGGGFYGSGWGGAGWSPLGLILLILLVLVLTGNLNF